jgi:ABC-type bacteriocin/lantibiotic exporter with double-glycine peptidase domain
MQAALALAATIAGISLCLLSHQVVWLIGAVLIFAVLPLTLLVIMPTNKKLLDPSLNRNSEAAHRLLQRWGKLHAVRSTLGFAASVMFLAVVLESPAH